MPSEDGAVNMTSEEDAAVNVTSEEDGAVNMTSEEDGAVNMTSEEDGTVSVTSEEDAAAIKADYCLNTAHNSDLLLYGIVFSQTLYLYITFISELTLIQCHSCMEEV